MRAIVITLAALLAIVAPALAADREQSAAAAAETRDQEQYEQSMKERLGRLGERLDQLRLKARTRAAEAEKRLSGTMTEKMAEAERKQQEAERKLKALGEASRESWQKFSVEAEKAAREFEGAVERIIKEE